MMTKQQRFTLSKFESHEWHHCPHATQSKTTLTRDKKWIYFVVPSDRGECIKFITMNTSKDLDFQNDIAWV